MNINQLFSDEDAVSPVIGVILMVAITVILAAVIGTFVLGLGDQVQTTSPQATFQNDFTQDASGLANDGSGQQDDVLNITHSGGDSIPASELSLAVSGGSISGVSGDFSSPSGYNVKNPSGDIGAGDIVTIAEADTANHNIPASSNNVIGSGDLRSATVKIVWTAPNGDSSSVLSEFEGPNA